jgi:O-antigen/teichoic acid export membrane protein
MILSVFKNRKELTSQTTLLLVSQAISMLLAISIDVINTKILGKDSFGLLSFINVFVFSAILFFDFGVPASGSRLLALTKNKYDERSMMGFLFVLTFFAGIIFGLFVFFASYFIEPIFNIQIKTDMQLVSLFVLVFPFQALIPMICRGSNLITVLAIYNVLPRLLYIILLLLLSSFVTYVTSFLFFSLSVILSSVILILYLRPNVNNFTKNYYNIKNEVKEYGLHLYSGNVVGNISQFFDRLLISIMMSTTSLGAYYLAIRISSPIKLVSQSLSVSVFKKFVDTKKIDSNIIKLNNIFLICSAIILVILSPLLVTYLFGNEYSEIITVIPILVVSLVLFGIAQPFNAFLTAKRQGKVLRNISIISPLINITFNCILISCLGLIGAALALVASYLVSLLLYVYYYKKVKMELA